MGGQVPDTAGHDSDWLWTAYSKVYDSIFHLMPYRELLWNAYQALELRPGMRILDAGCGTGNFEFFISEKNPPPVEIEAVDFSPAMLSIARNKCKGLEYVHFAHGDLNTELPYPDSSFDRILSINVLYALADRDRTMREFIRVLKPEGRMVLTSPAPHFGWPPLVIDHFKRVGNIWGAGRKALTVLDSIRVLSTKALGSFLLNVLVIYRRRDAGQYHTLDEVELRMLLDVHRRNGLEDFAIEPAFAEQNLFATAVKAAPAYAS